jgi:hypothetical protein
MVIAKKLMDMDGVLLQKIYRTLKDTHQSNLDDIERQELERHN